MKIENLKKMALKQILNDLIETEKILKNSANNFRILDEKL